MAVNFPASLDTSTQLPQPAAGNATNSPSHSAAHSNESLAIIAVETKLGTGATTAAANQILFGTGAGTSAWQGLTSAQLLAILSDETGTGSNVFATTPTLVTPKVDTINEATGGNGTTIGGVNIKSGALNTNNSVVTANITDFAVTSAKAAVGFCVQQVNTTTSAVATGTTLIPLDNTIPQSTEGDQYMSVSITPKATTNVLTIQVVALLSSSASNHIQMALFQDATASALASAEMFQATSGAGMSIPLLHIMTAGTTSSTTFKIRAGGNNAGTTSFNGEAGTQIHSTSIKSAILITEYKG